MYLFTKCKISLEQEPQVAWSYETYHVSGNMKSSDLLLMSWIQSCSHFFLLLPSRSIHHIYEKKKKKIILSFSNAMWFWVLCRQVRSILVNKLQNVNKVLPFNSENFQQKLRKTPSKNLPFIFYIHFIKLFPYKNN